MLDILFYRRLLGHIAPSLLASRFNAETDGSLLDVKKEHDTSELKAKNKLPSYPTKNHIIISGDYRDVN